MADWSVLNDLDNPSEVEAISSRVEAWDRSFAIVHPPRDALLYEPDGTLYAVCRRSGMSITYNHRTRSLHLGDLIVVPAGLALDLEPEVDLIGIRCQATPPPHFRERFIQVWGYEHFSAGLEPASGPPSGLREVLAPSDPRFRLAYSIHQVDRSSRPPLALDGTLELLVLLGIRGTTRIWEQGAPADEVLELPAGAVAVLGWPGIWQVAGDGTLGCLRLISEPMFQARWIASLTPRGPDTPFSPPAP
jgi:hypothetical protein